MHKFLRITKIQETRYKKKPITKHQTPKIVIVSWLLVVIWLLLLGYCNFASAIEITKIEACHNRTVDSIEFSTTGWVKAKGLLLDNQLEIVFPSATISQKIPIELARGSARIASFEVVQDGRTAKVIINLKKNVDYEIINIFGRDRTVVELYDWVDYTAQLMAAWEKTNLLKTGEKVKPYKYEGRPGPLFGKTIVVDPGHGGADPGAFTGSGIAEKYLTLQAARQVAAKLNSLGATVYLTRNTDRRYNLKDIVNFANSIPADIFICLHFNSSGQTDIAGTETYYYNDNSRRLARNVHTALIGELGRPDRGLRRTMFYTIHHTRMPAVLIEPLFLSNDKEAKEAVSPLYQERLADAVAKGVNHYFGN